MQIIRDYSYENLYDLICDSDLVEVKKFKNILKKNGLLNNDPRLVTLMNTTETNLNIENFTELIQNSGTCSLIEKFMTNDVVIPDFPDFCDDIKEIYNKCLSNVSGKQADYIPGLAKVNPNKFGISICTIDGQRFNIGDTNEDFCIQSCCKIVNYCLALEKHGEKKVHEHVGREPSGSEFNALFLDKHKRPHNPCINAGAIMTVSLLEPNINTADKFDELIETWTDLSGNIKKMGFNNGIYISEKDTADRNWALAYFMKEHKAFPPNPDLTKILEFYFQCCSLETTSEALSIVAGTLANGGVCPITNKVVFKPETVRNCLSIMSFAGMYDFSGEFGFLVGCPAKSGVGGGILLIIPNVMGICIWSPRLDEYGNSIRGIQFCLELSKQFNFHSYDNLVNLTSGKKDPRKKKNGFSENIQSLLLHASRGEVSEIKRLVLKGFDLNECDYDKRTALHLAASEGHFNLVKYIVEKRYNSTPTDRWGNTPYDDAIREGYEDIAEYLKANSELEDMN